MTTAPAAEKIEALPQPPVRDLAEGMVAIPAGSFARGCDRFGPEHGAPVHMVYLDEFMIDRYEITNSRYEELFPEHNLRRGMFSRCDRCPATKLTWYDAAEYCYLIGKTLPTEAQWEKAAGAANGCEFPWGSEFKPGIAAAHGGLTLKDQAAPVGSYPPNKFGIYDMAGNVWEWTADWFAPYDFVINGLSRIILHNPRGPLSGHMKIRRGGAWADSVKAMAAGYRDMSYPLSRSLNDVGFRCAVNSRPDGYTGGN
jgi:formylglycine-generating enzyme required for sulfatase activity